MTYKEGLKGDKDMKKGLVLIGMIGLMGCFPLVVKGEETTMSNQTESKETSRQTLPVEVQGIWVMDKNGEEDVVEITGETYLYNGATYEVVSYTKIGDSYTVIWDDQAYLSTYGSSEGFNPQPLMFDYNDSEDTLGIAGETYHRKEMTVVEKGDITYVDSSTFDTYVEGEVLPTELQDKWVATVSGEEMVWTIGETNFNMNGVLDYHIVAYGVTGQDYTLIWSITDYIEQYGKPNAFNPQPIMFTYDKESDVLVSGATVFHRGTRTKESVTEETSTSVSEKNTSSSNSKEATKKEEQNKALPKTNEDGSNVLIKLVTGLILMMGSFVVIKGYYS